MPFDPKRFTTQSRNRGLILIYKNKAYYLPADEKLIRIYIGRKHDNDIVVEDPKVSERHCEIIGGTKYGGGVSNIAFYIIDLESRNGTYLNNLRVSSRIKVSVNDGIKVGHTVYKVYDSSDSKNN